MVHGQGDVLARTVVALVLHRALTLGAAQPRRYLGVDLLGPQAAEVEQGTVGQLRGRHVANTAENGFGAAGVLAFPVGQHLV